MPRRGPEHRWVPEAHKKKKKKKKDGVSLSIEAPDGALKKYHLYFSPEG